MNCGSVLSFRLKAAHIILRWTSHYSEGRRQDHECSTLEDSRHLRVGLLINGECAPVLVVHRAATLKVGGLQGPEASLG